MLADERARHFAQIGRLARVPHTAHEGAGAASRTARRCRRKPSADCTTMHDNGYHCVLSAALVRVCAGYHSWEDLRIGARAGRSKLLPIGFLAVPVEVPHRASLPGGSCGTPGHAYLR